MHSLSMIKYKTIVQLSTLYLKLLSGSPNYQYILYNSSYRWSSVDITLVTNRAQWILLQLHIELSCGVKEDHKQQRLIKVVSKQCLTTQKCFGKPYRFRYQISRLHDIYLETSLRKLKISKNFTEQKVLLVRKCCDSGVSNAALTQRSRN